MHSNMERPRRDNSLTMILSPSLTWPITVAIFRRFQLILPLAFSSTHSIFLNFFSLASSSHWQGEECPHFFSRSWSAVETLKN